MPTSGRKLPVSAPAIALKLPSDVQEDLELLLGSVDASRTAAPEPVFPRGKARDRSLVRQMSHRVTPHRANTGPALRVARESLHALLEDLAREHHSLRPPPSLARFLAATRLALKRQQTLG